MNTPQIILTPRRPAVLAGFDSTLEVLVRVAAPDVPEAPATAGPARSPLHLALVIDRSGSMAGQPLEEAKKAAAFIIENLSPQDRASLVVYDSTVQTLVPLRDALDKEPFRRALPGIHDGGSTNLHGGWFAGAETLAPATTLESISRVILLSDGCANVGLMDTQAINQQCAELAAAGVTTSTYGLGSHFNEDLMIGMAKAGRGNSYYGRTAEDLMDPFREEFALLNNLCARRVVLELGTAPGVRAEVVNDYPKLDGGWQLPDLAYGGEAWALVRVQVPAGAESANAAALFTVSVRYVDLGGEPRAVLPTTLALPVVSSAAYGALTEDALVVRRVGELEAARLQVQAREEARMGNWGAVDGILASVREIGADNAWVAGMAMELQDLADRRMQGTFMKETAYSARKMANRLAPKTEAPAPGAESAAYLRRKNAQGKGT